MKKKNIDAKLKGRQEEFDKSATISKANQEHPGAYKRPGSRNAHKN
jgi:hypothetical protein